MTGTWKGTYVYNDPRSSLTPVDFTIEIDKMADMSFSGTVRDNQEMGGTPGKGEIQGRLTGDKVCFVKTMPVNVRMMPDGNRKIRPDKKHPALVYTGLYDSTASEIHGTWRFKDRKKFLWIGFLPWWYNLGNGTFHMKKERQD